MSELVLLIRNNEHLVSAYYLEYLKGCHRSKLESMLPEIAAASVAHNVCTVLAEALPSLEVHHDLTPMRIDWLRAALQDCKLISSHNFNYIFVVADPRTFMILTSIYVVHVCALAAIKLPSMPRLLKRMSQIYMASLFLDNLKEYMSEFTGLKNLWWYSHKVDPVFHGTLNFSTGDPLHCLCLLFICNEATENLIIGCPEEQVPLGNAICAKAGAFLNTVCE